MPGGAWVRKLSLNCIVYDYAAFYEDDAKFQWNFREVMENEMKD